MTIEKIKELNLPDSTYADGTRQIEMKINEIIGWINEHDNSGRHIVPSSSLTGGEKRESCTVCNWTNHNLKYGICDGCRDKVPEPKSNTLREKLGLIAFDGEVDEILSLVKEHLEKEINQSLKETKYDDNDREWAAKLQYNKAIYDIKQIIKNL